MIRQSDSNEFQKPGRFSLANLIGTLWSIHVLIAALLYPSILLPNDNAEDARKQRMYKVLSLVFGTLILFINILSLIVLFTRPTLIDAAKVLFILLTWLAVGIIFIVFNHLRDINHFFAMLEDEAIQSRDQSVMLIRAGQAALKAGTRKLLGWQDNEELSFTYLLKKVGPLTTFFLRKEGNLLHVGFEAFKLFVVGSRIFKQLF